MSDRVYRVDYNGGERHVLERDGRFYALEGNIFGDYRQGPELDVPPGAQLPAGMRLLAPVSPSKLVGIGLNYKDHAAEQGKPLPVTPVIFLKPPSAIVATGEPILLPPGVGRVDFEAEMAIVIGRKARAVPESEAGKYILGVTAVNDVTARDMQSNGVQYSHCKGFDTFAPMGPAIAVGLDPSSLSVECWVNGVRRQASTTRELVFTVESLVAFVSSIMTLLPGDVISTGTPAGIAPLRPGDIVTVRVEGVGDLTNPVLARA
ncbi:MAG: fumarylacetoacetate hydrolase family protein [Vicinamibacterales bacterium]